MTKIINDIHKVNADIVFNLGGGTATLKQIQFVKDAARMTGCGYTIFDDGTQLASLLLNKAEQHVTAEEVAHAIRAYDLFKNLLQPDNQLINSVNIVSSNDNDYGKLLKSAKLLAEVLNSSTDPCDFADFWIRVKEAAEPKLSTTGSTYSIKDKIFFKDVESYCFCNCHMLPIKVSASILVLPSVMQQTLFKANMVVRDSCNSFGFYSRDSRDFKDLTNNIVLLVLESTDASIVSCTVQVDSICPEVNNNATHYSVDSALPVNSSKLTDHISCMFEAMYEKT